MTTLHNSEPGTGAPEINDTALSFQNAKSSVGPKHRHTQLPGKALGAEKCADWAGPKYTQPPSDTWQDPDWN